MRYVPNKLLFIFLLVVTIVLGGGVAKGDEIATWPPQLNVPFPNLTLIDDDGHEQSLKAFAEGKVLLVMLSAMSCPGSQALAGGHRVGGYRGVPPQTGLPDFPSLFRTHTDGLRLDDEDLVFVQVLGYNMDLKAPTKDELRAWKNHFSGMQGYTFAATPELTSKLSKWMTPGLYLVDKSFVLRDSTDGKMHSNYIYDSFLPGVSALLDE